MSMKKEVVITDKTPLPFSPQPFCAAVKCNGMIYCSGIIGMDPKSMKMVEGPIGNRVVRDQDIRRHSLTPSHLKKHHEGHRQLIR